MFVPMLLFMRVRLPHSAKSRKRPGRPPQIQMTEEDARQEATVAPLAAPLPATAVLRGKAQTTRLRLDVGEGRLARALSCRRPMGKQSWMVQWQWWSTARTSRCSRAEEAAAEEVAVVATAVTVAVAVAVNQVLRPWGGSRWVASAAKCRFHLATGLDSAGSRPFRQKESRREIEASSVRCTAALPCFVMSSTVNV